MGSVGKAVRKRGTGAKKLAYPPQGVKLFAGFPKGGVASTRTRDGHSLWASSSIPGGMANREAARLDSSLRN